MTNLAIECSGTAGSVALFDRDRLIDYRELDARLGSVQTMAVEIECLLCGQAKPTLISVTNGPGSFTGLRVGLATAKMLSLAWNVPVVPVDTLQAIALRAFRAVASQVPQTTIISVINAFRGQVFTAATQFQEVSIPTILAPSCVLEANIWRSNPLAALGVALPDQEVWVSGPGLKIYPLTSEVGIEKVLQTVSSELWNPTACEVGLVGQIGFDAGSAQTAFTLEPRYIRASAAEEALGSQGGT